MVRHATKVHGWNRTINHSATSAPQCWCTCFLFDFFLSMSPCSQISAGSTTILLNIWVIATSTKVRASFYKTIELKWTIEVCHNRNCSMKTIIRIWSFIQAKCSLQLCAMTVWLKSAESSVWVQVSISPLTGWTEADRLTGRNMIHVSTYPQTGKSLTADELQLLPRQAEYTPGIYETYFCWNIDNISLWHKDADPTAVSDYLRVIDLQRWATWGQRGTARRWRRKEEEM